MSLTSLPTMAPRQIRRRFRPRSRCPGSRSVWCGCPLGRTIGRRYRRRGGPGCRPRVPEFVARGSGVRRSRRSCPGWPPQDGRVRVRLGGRRRLGVALTGAHEVPAGGQTDRRGRDRPEGGQILAGPHDQHGNQGAGGGDGNTDHQTRSQRLQILRPATDRVRPGHRGRSGDDPAVGDQHGPHRPDRLAGGDGRRGVATTDLDHHHRRDHRRGRHRPTTPCQHRSRPSGRHRRPATGPGSPARPTANAVDAVLTNFPHDRRDQPCQPFIVGRTRR